MGIHSTGPLTDWLDAVFCLLGVWALVFICKRFGVRRKTRFFAALAFAIPFLLLAEQIIPPDSTLIPHAVRSWVGNGYMLAYLACMAAALLLAVRNRAAGLFAGRRKLAIRRNETASAERRKFLQISSAAFCASPAIALGAGFATRKDFHVNEFDLNVPGLPRDLQGLRLLQLSDIHMGPFFTRNDLARVVDVSNGLRADLAFITGDLITDRFDPLDDCLKELSRLRSNSGVWGCLGNHELYSHVQNRTERSARALGITFLRHRAERLRFGSSVINLSGVDYLQHAPFLPAAHELISAGDFNLLLAHTPEAFPEAAGHRFDLTLSGHTHGGQINLDIFGSNFNIADIRTPYTKGLYTRGGSRLYVNSGLGTIGVPVRLGAPPEITLIRLCNT